MTTTTKMYDDQNVSSHSAINHAWFCGTEDKSFN